MDWRLPDVRVVFHDIAIYDNIERNAAHTKLYKYRVLCAVTDYKIYSDIRERMKEVRIA